ncbi:hypothetical protein RhiLY_11852 [Ceratobasidium sp. AG-Ba]|nr:hypothetical protein RhiLY_11852 [Ceratobasidium sp. AG-Ba]
MAGDAKNSITDFATCIAVLMKEKPKTILHIGLGGVDNRDSKSSSKGATNIHNSIAICSCMKKWYTIQLESKRFLSFNLNVLKVASLEKPQDDSRYFMGSTSASGSRIDTNPYHNRAKIWLSCGQFVNIEVDYTQ